MVQLFAHHGDGLMKFVDFLHLDPQTPLQHAVTVGTYGLLVAALAAGFLGMGGLGLVFRRLPARRASEPSLKTQRGSV